MSADFRSALPNSTARHGDGYLKRYRGLSIVKPIQAVKEAVNILDFARELCGEMRREDTSEWKARCPLPDHEERTPSFYVNPTDGVFFCHGCLRGGDLVELARLVWGYSQRDVVFAAVELANRYGVELPKRPARWYERQARKKPMLDAAEEARKSSFRRRTFRALVLPCLEVISDEVERRREIEASWSEWQERLRKIGR
jgi:hypothetical protein